MRDKRIIAITHPKLRKIRDEFRKLWFAVRSSIWREIQDELECMRFDENHHRILISERSSENLRHYRSLQEAQSNLRASFKGSICMCATCGSIESDMYYNLEHNAWFCLECVGTIRAGHTIIEAKKKVGTYLCDPDDFGEFFL